MKRAFALLTFVFISITSFAQDEESFRSNFVEGNQLMEEFNYSVALDIWIKTLADYGDNANVDYKAGVCLWKLPKRKQESLPYFQKAVKNVNDRYDPFSLTEEGAPIETYFYIANAYHLNYDLDSAIVYYNKFKNHINHNHEFWARTDLEIKMCETAKEALLNPVDIEVINIGSLVNSKYPDYAPVISVDESALYFTSKRLRSDSSNLYARNPEDGEFYEDIYVSYKGDDGAWNEPEPLNFNTSSNEATLSLSADGETMYIYKTGQKGYGDLYYSNLDGENWTEPQPLGSDINSEDHETHAAVTPDGNRLYFISDREGSMKFPDKAHQKVESKDIYFCNLLPTGEWALAQPLTELNTAYHEDGIFIHPDGKTMFFSSEGHGSMGGFDIFTTEYQEDSTWSKPVNIGYPLNTTDDDIFFVTSASGKRAYYSSIREDGYGDKDVYVISMLSFKEKPLTLLIGEITSADGAEVPDGIFIYVTDNESGDEIGTFKPRARDNKFTIIIPPGSDYHLDYVYGDSTFYTDDIFVPFNSSYQEINKGISLGGIDFSGLEKAKEEELIAGPKAETGPENPSVEGKLKYGAAGAAGVLLNLEDENHNKIASTTTDGSGNFVFRNLGEGSIYYVAIDPSNGQAPENAQLYMKDTKTGSMLPVTKLADGSFGFETLPFMSAEELELMAEEDATPIPAGVNVGPKRPTVQGNLKYGSAAAAGVLVNLEDENHNKIGSTITDEEGDFKFRTLEPGSKYFVMIDPANGEVPDNAKLFIKDEKTGKMLPVSRMADGSFAFETLPYMTAEELKTMAAVDDTPTPKGTVSGPKNPKVEGNLKYGGAAAAGVLIALNDKDKNKLFETETDELGNFEFQNLNASTAYGLEIMDEVPDDVELSLKDATTGEMLPVSRMADGSFAFETLPFIAAEELEVVEAKEEAPKKQTMPPAYRTEVKEIDGEKYIIHEVREGETMFDISLIYNLKFPVVQEANPGVGDLIYAGDQIKLPIPVEVQFYQEFFDYNVFSIRTSGDDYKNFLTQVEKAVTERGKATLMIESSSSKVPSKAEDNGNKKLSIKRAENAKETLIKSMSELNVPADKLNFADMSTLVRGPEFNNDAKENRATYKNFQYVKIIVK